MGLEMRDPYLSDYLFACVLSWPILACVANHDFTGHNYDFVHTQLARKVAVAPFFPICYAGNL